MAKRYRVKHNSKPLFKTKKKSGSSLFGIVFMIIILAALVFLGYSVGKPILGYFKDGPDTPAVNSDDDSADTEDILNTDPIQTQSDVSDVPDDIVPEDENPEPVKKNILYIRYADRGEQPYEDYILSRIDFAKESGFSGVCVELVLTGGQIAYNTSVKLANDSGAVLQDGVSSLKTIADSAADAGLFIYARVSSLSDNVASWYDNSICYMIDGTAIRWLDNSLEKGGKPWISPFRSAAGEYIGALVNEISEAGFAGLVAGEIVFPPLRNSDLDYIGDIVKSADRHKALASFCEIIFNSLGTAKSFYIEVNAKDIISGSAEILKDPSLLCTKTLYVSFNPSDIGMRIARKDGTEVSFEGLSSAYMLKAVIKLAYESLSGSGIEIIPVISGCEINDEMLSVLDDMGYADKDVVIAG